MTNVVSIFISFKKKFALWKCAENTPLGKDVLCKKITTNAGPSYYMVCSLRPILYSWNCTRLLMDWREVDKIGEMWRRGKLFSKQFPLAALSLEWNNYCFNNNFSDRTYHFWQQKNVKTVHQIGPYWERKNICNCSGGFWNKVLIFYCHGFCPVVLKIIGKQCFGDKLDFWQFCCFSWKKEIRRTRCLGPSSSMSAISSSWVAQPPLAGLPHCFASSSYLPGSCRTLNLGLRVI